VHLVLVPGQKTYRVYPAGPSRMRPNFALLVDRIVVVDEATAAETPTSAITDTSADTRAALPEIHAVLRPTARSVVFTLLLRSTLTEALPSQSLPLQHLPPQRVAASTAR
jgi:hypothetical protein